jgi:hypothetical protein
MDRKRARVAGLLVLAILLLAVGLWSPWSAPKPEETTESARVPRADPSPAAADPAASAAAPTREAPEGEEETTDPAGFADETEVVSPAPEEAAAGPDAIDPAKVRPAVRRNPRDPPRPPPGSRPLGGRGGPRPTGLWEKFPPKIPTGRAAVEVSVVDRDGRPVPGADVYLGPPDIVGEAGVSYAHLRKLGKTDAAGTLVAKKLPEGGAAVAGNLNGLLNIPMRGLDATTAVAIVLVADKTAEVKLRLPVTIAEMGAVRGVVRCADGEPAASAQVLCGLFRVTAGRDGTFEIRNLPAGETALNVSRSGHRPASVPVVIEPGKTAEVEIDLEYRETGNVALRGAVLGPDGEGVADATVYLMVSEGRGGGTIRSTRTGADGQYAMDSLPDRLQTASVRIQASRMGYRAAVVSFPDGLAAGVVDLRLPVRMTRLRLTVVDAATDRPQDRCRFLATHAETGKRGAGFSTRSATGVYETWIEPGAYEFLIEAPDHRALRATVEVPAKETFDYGARLRHEGAPSVEVSLTVVVTAAATGEPVPEARVVLLERSEDTPVARMAGRRPDGRFRLPAPSGEWRLRVTAPGFEPVEQPLRLEPDEPEAVVDVVLR